MRNRKISIRELPKTPTGIRGLDEITYGGLAKGRPTLVSGGAGCGKTLLGLEFLANGARQYSEPGVFMAFEETPEELIANVSSLGFGLDRLVAKKQIALDHIRIERSEIEETGEYDLEGLFIRLQLAIESVGAKRVVLDTLEALFAGFSNESILRAELRRLFQWLKARNVTAVVTAERGEDTLTRTGLEEYVADCVIMLDNRVIDQISTRRLRIVKYRGSAHGGNEFPFLIDDGGFSVMPITSLSLDHPVSSEIVPSGVPDLDEMLGAGGYQQRHSTPESLSRRRRGPDRLRSRRSGSEGKGGGSRTHSAERVDGRGARPQTQIDGGQNRGDARGIRGRETGSRQSDITK